MKKFKFRNVISQIPNLLWRRRFQSPFELLPLEATELGVKKTGNFFLAGLNQFLLPAKPVGHSVIAQIEPANFCNLSCPLCLTTLNHGSRSKMTPSFDTFTRFIDTVGDCLLLIALWMNGEPFLNRDIFNMIGPAKTKHIVVHTSTNGNVQFDDEKAAMLIESGQMCEDMERILRARQKGYRPYYAPDVVVTHDPDCTTFESVLKHSVSRGSETIHVRNRYRSLLKTPCVLRSPVLFMACASVIDLKVTAGTYLDNWRLARHFWTAPVIYRLKMAWCWGAARSLWMHKSKK